MFLKVLCFIMALKLASCNPVVVDSAKSIYDRESLVTSQNFGDDDVSDGTPVDDVKEDFSAQKTKDDKIVKDFWAKHPVDLHDEKFVASENFKKDYKNAFGSEFNI